MISPRQIQRMIDAGLFSRLVERILDNGRRAAPGLRMLLAQPGIAAVAGLGLALQRMCELTYRPNLSTAMIAARLMKLQREDGMFGGEHTSPAASAVALRGLIVWRDLLRNAPADEDAGERSDAIDRLNAAIDYGVQALAMIDAAGELDDTERSALQWQLSRELAQVAIQPQPERRHASAA